MDFNRYKIVLLHLLGISLFVGYDIVLLFIFDMPPTLKGYLAFALDIATFYANLLWVVPHLFVSGKQILFLGRALILIAVHLILRSLITYWGKAFEWDSFISGKTIIVGSWRLFYVLGLGFLIGLFRDWQRRERERQALQLSVLAAAAETARIESLLFQMQLSPHLLFNALTLIQAKAREVLPAVGEAVGLVADMCRHSLIDIRNVRKINLADEIREIDNRIRLQECLDEAKPCLAFSTNINEHSSHVMLPPSLLLTLTDNVIKYGVLNDPEFPARIEIALHGKELRYYSWNFKATNVRPGTGLGIQSVQNILDYYYPGKYTLTITDNEEMYSLELKIEL